MFYKKIGFEKRELKELRGAADGENSDCRR